MSRTERAKGARGEREIVRAFKDYGWENARRTSDGHAQDQRGDIQNGPPGYHFEVKRQERLNVPAALDQAAADAGGLVPVVIHRPSRHSWMVTMPLHDMLMLMGRGERLGQLERAGWWHG